MLNQKVEQNYHSVNLNIKNFDDILHNNSKNMSDLMKGTNVNNLIKEEQNLSSIKLEYT